MVPRESESECCGQRLSFGTLSNALALIITAGVAWSSSVLWSACFASFASPPIEVSTSSPRTTLADRSRCHLPALLLRASRMCGTPPPLLDCVGRVGGNRRASVVGRPWRCWSASCCTGCSCWLCTSMCVHRARPIRLAPIHAMFSRCASSRTARRASSNRQRRYRCHRERFDHPRKRYLQPKVR